MIIQMETAECMINSGKMSCEKISLLYGLDIKEIESCNGKQLIFNARSESALEKKMFKESVKHRRVVVPATWFYEWNKNKEKNIFYREKQPVLYMAGLYNYYQSEERFVILTTAANESIKPIHDRMPLLLERDEIEQWLFEDSLTESLLHKNPALLKRRTDFEQISLFPRRNTGLMKPLLI